jgi:hypothetical protein
MAVPCPDVTMDPFLARWADGDPCNSVSVVQLAALVKFEMEADTEGADTKRFAVRGRCLRAPWTSLTSQSGKVGFQ